jgi:serine/threonine-protein kinase
MLGAMASSFAEILRSGRAPKPARLGRYTILGELASGGMGTVYLARAHGEGGFERIVALKVCRDEFRNDPEFGEKFLQEARLAARIHHPNVVATLDVGSASDTL